MTDARASELMAWMDFEVSDEDVSDYELIGRCSVAVSAAAFMGASQTNTCPVDAASGSSGFTVVWHLEGF